HPLCGNGMAMAIHSAKLVSELVSNYFKEKTSGRKQLEEAYQATWNNTFQHRLWMGRKLQSLLLNPNVSQWALSTVGNSQWILNKLIKSTHGKPIDL
ncbi:MAG: flavin-dependent dehydrogenase, partial [Sediminicola sp.]